MKKLDKRIVAGIGLLIALVVIVGLVSFGGKGDLADKKAENKKTLTKTIPTAAVVQEESNQEKIIDETTKSEITKVIQSYYAVPEVTEKEKTGEQAVETASPLWNGIEAYEAVQVYIRAGLDADTYVVFITYDMKFENIDTVAPGMGVLNVMKDKTGVLVITKASEDEKFMDYMDQLYKDVEIKGIIEQVNTELKTAMEKDKALKAFITKLESDTKK